MVAVQLTLKEICVSDLFFSLFFSTTGVQTGENPGEFTGGTSQPTQIRAPSSRRHGDREQRAAS